MVRERFDKQLKDLNDLLIEMGNAIEGAIKLAVEALRTQNVELAQTVIEGDREIDELEKEIEAKCLKLLLQQQPVASDLRTISSALKIITDMERIGDHAENIAEWVYFSITGEHFKKHKQI